MITVDADEYSVLMLCDECPTWFFLASDRVEGWRAARSHEQDAHPGSKQATNALAHYEKQSLKTVNCVL